MWASHDRSCKHIDSHMSFASEVLLSTSPIRWPYADQHLCQWTHHWAFDFGLTLLLGLVRSYRLRHEIFITAFVSLLMSDLPHMQHRAIYLHFLLSSRRLLCCSRPSCIDPPLPLIDTGDLRRGWEKRSPSNRWEIRNSAGFNRIIAYEWSRYGWLGVSLGKTIRSCCLPSEYLLIQWSDHSELDCILRYE